MSTATTHTSVHVQYDVFGMAESEQMQDVARVHTGHMFYASDVVATAYEAARRVSEVALRIDDAEAASRQRARDSGTGEEFLFSVSDETDNVKYWGRHLESFLVRMLGAINEQVDTLDMRVRQTGSCGSVSVTSDLHQRDQRERRVQQLQELSRLLKLVFVDSLDLLHQVHTLRANKSQYNLIDQDLLEVYRAFDSLCATGSFSRLTTVSQIAEVSARFMTIYAGLGEERSSLLADQERQERNDEGEECGTGFGFVSYFA